MNNIDSKKIIQQILDYLELKAPTFANNIGVPYQRVYDIQRGKTKKISGDVANAIHSSYSLFNLNWLLTGEGEMLKHNEAKVVSEFEFMNVPFVPIHAQAGYRRGYGDQEYIDTLPTVPVIVDKAYRGKYRVFEVEGDSMDDNTRDCLCDGDKVLGREVKRDLWKSKLHFHDWYFVVVTKENGILIKQIVDHDVEVGIITCHSLNNMFEDFKISLDEVAELYNVIKLVDRNTRI